MSVKRPQIDWTKADSGKGVSIWAEQTFSDGIHLSNGANVATAYRKAARRLRAMANECDRLAKREASNAS